jgi:hypothetical protein
MLGPGDLIILIWLNPCFRPIISVSVRRHFNKFGEAPRLRLHASFILS